MTVNNKKLNQIFINFNFIYKILNAIKIFIKRATNKFVYEFLKSMWFRNYLTVKI